MRWMFLKATADGNELRGRLLMLLHMCVVMRLARVYAVLTRQLYYVLLLVETVLQTWRTKKKKKKNPPLTEDIVSETN